VLDVSPELPAAYGDSVMLERAVENVLENALRHGPIDREIRVTGAYSNDSVELRVIDHGTGVAPGDRERMFEEFVQLEGARVPGVGLGLAITRAFVDSNGGSVCCEETPGGGATLVLTLPAQGPEDAL
jgi:two-component system sensor histidine kinase KdpD